MGVCSSAKALACQGVFRELIPIPGGWSVVLDMGRDLGATELDAIYIESALSASGIPAVFSPWHPSQDTLTPLGCTRAYKVAVPEGDRLDARVLVEDVLDGRGERYEVLLPVDDAWVLRYQVSATVLPLLRLSKINRFWLLILRMLRIYLVGVGLLVIVSAVSQLVTWLSGGL